jgi:hypothetical protein
LGGFLQHLDHEGFELGLQEESFGSCVVFVEVGFEFIPNGIDEGEFFGGDVARRLHLEAAALQIDSVSEVLFDEVEVLLESNEAVIVSIQLLEYINQIFSCWLDFNEETKFSK